MVFPIISPSGKVKTYRSNERTDYGQLGERERGRGRNRRSTLAHPRGEATLYDMILVDKCLYTLVKTQELTTPVVNPNINCRL